MAFFTLNMSSLAIAALLSSLLFEEVILARCDVATAASYGPPYTPTKCGGSSQDQFPAGKMFAAVSEGLWDNGAACGRMYRLRCLSGANRPCKRGTIDVEVVDECSADPCPANLLLSRDAFAAISRVSDSRINVEYAQI